MSAEQLEGGSSAPEQDEKPRKQTLREWVYDECNGPLDSAWEFFVLYLIFACTFLFIVGTLNVGVAPNGEHHLPCQPPPEGQDKCDQINNVYGFYLDIFEAFAVITFTAEYVARMWSVVEDPTGEFSDPVFGRIRFAFTFFSLIDLAAILPWWIKMMGLWDLESFQAIRAVRLLRLLKAEQYVKAIGLLETVISDNAVLLLAASFYAFLMLCFSATALYYTEKENGLETQQYFQSIPQAMFPCLLMLTGEFPLADFTPIGQVIASGMAVVAVAFFAIPTSVLGAGL